jgi:alpha-amylase
MFNFLFFSIILIKNLLICMKLVEILFFALFLSVVSSATAEQWKGRTIYQLLTDRFARNDGAKTQCSNLGNYCGGGYKGIINNLDYIQGMGFDAIWISPILQNRAGDYHGYAATDLYKLN